MCLFMILRLDFATAKRDEICKSSFVLGKRARCLDYVFVTKRMDKDICISTNV